MTTLKTTRKSLIEDDFNEPVATFATDYLLRAQAYGAGTAAVVTTPPAWGLGSNTGHGGSGDRFLMVDGATDASKSVWGRDVELVQGQAYEFRVWVNANAGVLLQLQVGGIDVGLPIAPTAEAGWQEQVVSFVATTSGSTRVGLRGLTTSPTGNDYGIDDVRLDAVAAPAPSGDNLIVGGDFNSSFQTFHTDYALRSQADGAGTAAVVTAPPAWGLGSQAGHGGSGDRFLMVDGARDVRQVVWGQDVALVQGQAYEFSVWTNANAGVALQLQVGGSDVGLPMTPIAGAGWHKQVVGFVASATGTTRVGLRGLGTDWRNNDYGLDDIRLQALPSAPQPAPDNLIVGGDFNASFTSFSTDYEMRAQADGAGTAAVVTTPPAWGLGSQTGHGGMGDRFLMVDGATDDSKSFWGQDVALVKGHAYEFSVWVNANAGVVLQLQVGGMDLGPTMVPQARAGWQKLAVRFTAPEDGNTRVSLRDLATSSMLNDFGVDDLRLRSVEGEPVPETPPTSGSMQILMREDVPHVFALQDFPFHDADAGDRLASVRFTEIPKQGRLSLFDGENWRPLPGAVEIPAGLIEAGKLRYASDKDQYGFHHSELQFRVSDGRLESVDSEVMAFHVLPVNDAPTLAPAPIKTLWGVSADGQIEIGFQDLAAVTAVADIDSGLNSLAFVIESVDAGWMEIWSPKEAGWSPMVPGMMLTAIDRMRWHAGDVETPLVGAFTVRATDGLDRSVQAMQIPVQLEPVAPPSTSVLG